MKNVILASIMAFITAHSASQQHSKTEEVTCLMFTDIFPIMLNDGKLRQFAYDTVLTYYYDGMKMYRLQKDHTNVDPKDRSKRSVTTTYTYFVCENKGGHGILYNGAASGQWKSADSVVFNQEFCTNAKLFYSIFNTFNTNLVSKTEVKDSGLIHEVYAAVNKKDTAQKSTIYLSFSSRLNKYDFTLSPELDSLRKMKLYRYRVVTPKWFMRSHNITIDASETSSMISEVPVSNTKEILAYFENFKKESAAQSKK